jgi:tetratricopeptide (TPR) repeat protein
VSLSAGKHETFEFRSELVREVAYETLTKAERARRHAAVGARLESRLRQTDREDEYLEHLAHHYGMAAELVCELGSVAGVPDDISKRALIAIERAAIRAKQRETPRVSLRLLDHALRLLPDDAEGHRRLVFLERAKAKTTLRDLSGARADLEQGMALAQEAGDAADVARALTIRGEVEQKEEDLVGSELTLTDAIEMLRELEAPHLLGEALRQRGMTRLFRGDSPAAEADIEEALAAARAAGLRQEEAWALWSLAWNTFAQGRLTEAEERLHQASEVFGEIGDWGAASWAMGLLAWVRYFQGRRVEAEQIALKVLGPAREAGDRWALAMTLVLLSGVRLWEGRPDQAIEPAREALALFKEIDDARGNQQALASLTRSLAAAGRVDEARALLDEQRAQSPEALPDQQGTMMLAACLLQFGEAEEALEAVGDVGMGFNVGGEMGRSEGRTMLGLALLQLGNPLQAADELRAAADEAPGDGPRSNAYATLGLALVSAGDAAGALAAAEVVPTIESATYADRSMAELVTGLAHLQLGDPSAAVAELERALCTVDATGDRFMQATLRIAVAEGFAAMEHPGAAAMREDGEARLSAMGVAAPGWRNAFRLAAGAGSGAANRL